MSGRKPPGTSWESFVEQQIRAAQERGEFDDLPGKGKPLPGLDGTHDELWWVKAKLRREEVSHLPPTLMLRKQKEDALALVKIARDEAQVREIITELNTHITNANRMATSGPPTTLMPLDVDDVVVRWRASRATGPER